MRKGTSQLTLPVIDLMLGLWRRADRDFKSKAARKAFRDTCSAVLRGELVDFPEPPEDTDRESSAWAAYVAAEDCKSVQGAIESIENVAKANRIVAAAMPTAATDESDSDEDIEMVLPYSSYRFIKRRRMADPSKDRRFKRNKTEVEIERQKQLLDDARAKSVAVMDEKRGYSLLDYGPEQTVEQEGPQEETSSHEEKGEPSGVGYMERRKKNCAPVKVAIPPLPKDYRMENEWVQNNIKSPDMLYSYVLKKTGEGVTWSGGLRKFFNSNDFWEFAFDTLSSGGWKDSETNKPISNISKYITKATIGEYVRHERTKYSIFDGKFKTGKELLDYIEMHCPAMDAKYRTEEYAEWFLHQMNDIGWRFNNGATINNLPKAMSDKFDAFLEWCKNNSANLEGLNPNQYGETLRIQKAIERGEWKPTADGKFRAIDLLKIAQKKD